MSQVNRLTCCADVPLDDDPIDHGEDCCDCPMCEIARQQEEDAYESEEEDEDGLAYYYHSQGL